MSNEKLNTLPNADSSRELSEAHGSAVVAIAAVQLSKLTTFPGGHMTSHSMTLHHRAGITSENEMRGIAVEEALRIKPGFSIDQVLVTFASLPNAEVSDAKRSLE